MTDTEIAQIAIPIPIDAIPRLAGLSAKRVDGRPTKRAKKNPIRMSGTKADD